MTAPALSWADVCARRLARHGLATPGAVEPADVAGRICGAHAQIITAGELSLGIRTAGSTQAGVRAALWTERSLVKTYGPRGTVHLLRTADLAMWTGALAAVPQAPGGWPDEVRLTDDQTEEVVQAIGAALRDDELTVDELDEAVAASAGPWAADPVLPAWESNWPRWRQAMHTAAHRGVLCFGPNRGRRVTYTHPHRWLPGFTPAAGAAALHRLVHDYLHAYGPATPAQFARWLSAPAPWAVALFEDLAGAIVPADVEGEVAWQVAGDDAPGEPPRGVRLLPYFDAYAVGCHPRERVFPGAVADRALSGGQAGNFPVLLVDGVVAGVWHQRRSGRRLHVTVEPLRRLGAARRRDLDAQVARIGTFFGTEPELTIGEVTVGGHR